MRNQIARLLIIALPVAIIAGCASTPSQQGISGVISGAEGETVFLERFINNKVVRTDSATIGTDGKFQISPTPPLELNFYRLSLTQENHLVILTDSSESLRINTASGSLHDGQAEGSSNTELILEFRDSIVAMDARMMALSLNLREEGVSREEMSQIKQKMAEAKNYKKQFAQDFIKSNQHSPAVFSALTELNLRQDVAIFETVLDNTKEQFGHSFQYKSLAAQVTAQKQQLAAQKGDPGTQSKNNKFQIGMMAPNISMKNPDGQNMSLNDLKGKVVLLDFWASWCGPCRRENPNVIKAYNKYNKDGFEVFSVSLDRSIEPWKKAIEQDALIWPYHVSDLKGWKSDAAALYGIHSIPHTLLLDREGKIAGTHLRGAALEAQLAQMFGH